jgi:hypothetical protein
MTEIAPRLEADPRSANRVQKIFKVIFGLDREQRAARKFEEEQRELRNAAVGRHMLEEGLTYQDRQTRIGEFSVSPPITSREELDKYLQGPES